MTFRVALSMMLFAVAAPAAAMPVSTFLAKAEALKKKGPLAIFSSDVKVLMNQMKQDADTLKAENKAAEAAGRKKAYCTQAEGVKLSDRDILGALNAVPAAQRASTSTKDAMRVYLARRFPCRG